MAFSEIYITKIKIIIFSVSLYLKTKGKEGIYNKSVND